MWRKKVWVILASIVFGMSCIVGYYLETDMSYGMMAAFGIGDMFTFIIVYNILGKLLQIKKMTCLREVGGG